MGTITCLIKTEELYGLGSITCGSPTLSDSLVFCPPSTFGSVQALFSSSNAQRVKDHFLEGKSFETIGDDDPYHSMRQYVFFNGGEIKEFTGDKVPLAFVKKEENIIVCGNRVGKESYGENLFNSLVKYYSNDLEDVIIKSFRENKYIGFDDVCKSRGISSTTFSLKLFQKSGKLISSRDLYHSSKDIIDLI
jgi:hypothetical protein